MNIAADILARVQAAGIRLEPLPDGRIKVAPRSRLTDELRSLIVEHKVELIAVLEIRPDPAAEARRQRVLANPEVFAFNPPGDPANDTEALAERVAIMMEANGWDEVTALREARWHADRERCWRAFLRNAARVLQAPKAEREALLARYRAEAERRYGEATGRDMALSLRGWVLARGVH